MINFTFNGTSMHCAELSVEQLVKQEIGHDTGVAVAINAAVVPRSQWSRMISNEDSVEILTAIQGG
ncbi:sulfur transfer protein [Corynebacterium suranareeae]|uniref:Sulfur transfer protein n=1 Tax=Corynebacterium suranareeae TaxID=2506452 RepID=A0A160PRU3_9CORY|nr:sulfur carrier protein ThiS [Corynebacterium suranareeae]BAU96374.1 sulfur transfer protein [Corynebacterium suranareeae]